MSNLRDYRDSHLEKGETYDHELSHGAFNFYMAQQEALIVPKIVAGLFPHGVPRYLDFACGTGRITSLIERLAAHSVGVDISESMLRQARRKCPQTRFIRRDMTLEPLDVPPVDLVSAFRFFGNAQPELRAASLAAIGSILVHGGYLILNNHRNLTSAHRLIQRTLGRQTGKGVSYGGLNSLLTRHGFKILRTYGIGLCLIRDRFMQPDILRSSVVRMAEPVSRSRFFGPLCPDYVLVARYCP